MKDCFYEPDLFEEMDCPEGSASETSRTRCFRGQLAREMCELRREAIFALIKFSCLASKDYLLFTSSWAPTSFTRLMCDIWSVSARPNNEPRLCRDFFIDEVEDDSSKSQSPESASYSSVNGNASPDGRQKQGCRG